MRVWGKEGITCPCIASAGRDGTDASVALATDFSGRPFATRTPIVGALLLRLVIGASGAKKNPLAPESAIPVREDGSLVGLRTDGVDRA